MNGNIDGQQRHSSEDQLKFDEISLNMAPVHPMSYVLSPAGDAILSSSAEQSPASGNSPTATVPPVTISGRIEQQQQAKLRQNEATKSAKDNDIEENVTNPSEAPQAQQMPSAQHSPPPPPIYSAIYPPGTHPAAPSRHIGQFTNCSPTYIIDAGTIRNGCGAELSPTLLVHGTTGVLKSAHLSTPPVLILTDPFAEFARRRRTLAVLSLLLLFFPMVAFLLIVLSMHGMNSNQQQFL